MKRLFALIAAALLTGAVHAAEFPYTAAANRFGLEGLRLLLEAQPQQNVVYSPLSAHLALSMLLNGADQKTAQEISHVLGLPLTQLVQANASAMKLLKDLNSRPDSELKLIIANGLWTRPDLRVKASFMNAVKESFQAEVAPLTSAEAVDVWAAQKTNGLIRKIIERTDDLDMILANATYFKAKWTMPFRLSYEGDFTAAGGQKLRAKLMRVLLTTNYLRENGYEAIALPYGEGRMASFIAVLPEAGKDLAEFRKTLTAETLDQLTARLGQAKADRGEVVLPKVEFQTQFNMNPALTALGMPSAFTDTADFRNLSDDPVKVSYVKQDAVIKINEEGTEAAAVTSVGMTSTSVQAPPAFRFVADHPFFYFIRDNATGVILFAGQVVRP